MRNSTLIGYTKATLAAFALIALTQSCQKSADAVATAPTVTTVSDAHLAELKQSISTATGAPVSQIDYSASTATFTISKDALLSLADAEGYFKAQPGQTTQSTERTEQRINSYSVNSTRVRNITVYCDGTVPSDWVSIMDMAIANWNAAGSAIHFTRVTSQYTTTSTTSGSGKKKNSTTTTTTSADVVVTTFNDNTTSVIAQGYYPTSTGAPGNKVNINLYYTYLSTAYREFALTHELGHVLGFTHTNETYGTLINGTPVTDASSVMNSVCLSWSSFTNYDLTAFRTIYPY
jgi:hypothetical protein